MNESIEKTLIKLLKKAAKRQEIPVAALIERNGKIISKAYNKRVESHDVTDHAEIIAIRKAEKKIKDWRLNGYNMYVTLEPCEMCKNIINESRIDNCFIYLKKSKQSTINNHTKVSYKKTKYNSLFEKILKDSFKKMR